MGREEIDFRIFNVGLKMSSYTYWDCIVFLVLFAYCGYGLYTEHAQISWTRLFVALYCMVVVAVLLGYVTYRIWKGRRDRLTH